MKFLRGQSLFEVVGALAVISLLIVGLINITTTSVRNTTFSRNNSVANGHAQQLSEWLRGQRDTNWVSFKANAEANGGIYCFDNLNWSNSGVCGTSEVILGTTFKRSAVFTCFQGGAASAASALCSSALVNIIQANITVTWTDGQGDHNVNLTTQLTNW